MRPAWFTVVPPLDRNARVVAFAQTLVGKLVLLAVYGVLLYLHEKSWLWDMMVIIAAMTFFPAQRRALLLVATFFWLSKYTLFDWHVLNEVVSAQGVGSFIDLEVLRPTLIAAALLFCAVFYGTAVHWQQSYAMRRPIVTLFCVYFTLIVFVWYVPLSPLWRTYIWGFIIVFGRYIWFLCYSLLDRGQAATDGFPWQLRSYLPFWIGLSTSPTPIAKGAVYLRRIEAKNPAELAVTQLKGIKLLWWAYVLMAVETAFNGAVHGTPGYMSDYFSVPFSAGLPTYFDAFYKAVAGEYYPWYLNWLSLLARLFTNVLYLAIWGHIIISACRMAGFNALRGTYKPLAATTLAEFWNRYFYYFKELLVEFFFYPTYLRYFKRHPRLRLFFATVMAAGFGNVLFHYIRDIQHIIAWGPWQALLEFHVYVFYGLVLGTGIGISQLRSRTVRPATHWFRRQVLSRVGVVVFYCFVLIFDNPDRSLSIQDNFVFVFSLFNIHLR